MRESVGVVRVNGDVVGGVGGEVRSFLFVDVVERGGERGVLCVDDGGGGGRLWWWWDEYVGGVGVDVS